MINDDLRIDRFETKLWLSGLFSFENYVSNPCEKYLSFYLDNEIDYLQAHSLDLCS